MTEQVPDSEGFIQPTSKTALKVTVTDIDISFGSLVKIMFKATFAALVVSALLGVIGLVGFVILLAANR